MIKIKNRFKNIARDVREISAPRMSVKQQTFVMKRLSFLIKAGIPVMESVRMIGEQTRKKSHAVIFKTVAADVERGLSLAASLAKFEKMFGDFSIHVISFGESAGILSDNLAYLAEELQKKDALRKKILGAFLYPIIVTLATFGITGFLMVYLFPKIMPVFSSLHIALPVSTRIILFSSNFLRQYGIALIFGSIISVLLMLAALKKSRAFHFYFDAFLLKIPIIGNILKRYNLANSTRTLGLLLQSGVTISESLQIASTISGNEIYKKEFAELSLVVNRGERMSAYLASARNLFPDILTQIIAVGERSGSLSESFTYVSHMYEAEVDDFTKNLGSTIEPVLMIIMGIMVGFIAISIITPIYGITQHLQPR